MAFILKSTKCVRAFAGFTRQRGLIRSGKKCVFLEGSSVFCFDRVPKRPSISLAANEVKEKDYEQLENIFMQLSADIKKRNIFIEDIKEILEAVKQKGKITYPQIILLLKCCSEVAFISTSGERIHLAEDIWKTAVDTGAQLEITHYNALLSVFLDNNHKFSPTEFLTALEKDGVEPNVVTYRRILRAYCQQGDMEGANNTLNKMKQLNYPLAEEDFNSLILGHCEVGDLEKASGILKLMEQKNIDPTRRSHLCLLCGYAKHGEIDKLKEMLEELPKKDISLPNSFLLEIVYALAANGRTEHVDMILQRLSSDYENVHASNRIIHRLLHEKLDSVAFKIFEKVGRKVMSSDFTMNQSRYLLRHFLEYRNPEEVVDLCCQLEEKGWSKTGLSYILKQAFEGKDELFCVDLLNAMWSRKVEVRSHYYWPAIIKASEKGKSQMVDILKCMPTWMIANCQYTTSRVFLPNYRFEGDWREEYGALKNLGLRTVDIGKHIIEKLILEEKFNEVENLASSVPVGRTGQVLHSLAQSLVSHPDEDKRFVNTLRFLTHDWYCSKKSFSEEPAEEIAEEINKGGPSSSIIHPFDYAVRKLVALSVDENVFLRVLENMSEKNMGITMETASLITASYQNQRIADVVNTLTKLHFQYDNEVISRKQVVKISSEVPEATINFSYLTSDTEANVERLLQEVKHMKSLEEYMSFLRQLVKKERSSEAVKLAEHLSQREDIYRAQELNGKSMYFPFVLDLCRGGQSDLAAKAISLGVDMGLLEERDTISFIRQLFQQGKVSEAVDMYCDYIRNTEKTNSWKEFLTKAVAGENNAAVKKLTTTICRFVPENLCLSQLALALVDAGQLKSAKKLLDGKLFTFSNKIFYNRCNLNFDQITSKVLENYFELVKNIEQFDRTPLYKLMIEKYAEEKDVESAKKLWLHIEEDDISNYDFLDKMREFVNDPTVANLRMLGNTFSVKSASDDSKTPLFKHFLAANDLEKAFTMAMESEIPLEDVQNLVVEFATDGKMEKVVRLLSKYKVKIRKVASVLLEGERVEECLKFLNYFAAMGNFTFVANGFEALGPQEILEKDDALFEQYKSLAIQCYENESRVKPLSLYFMTCLCMPRRLKDAEAVFQRYPGHFRNTPLIQIKRMKKSLIFDFYRGIVSSDIIKSHFSDQLPRIYSTLIRLNCTADKLKDAVDNLHEAANDGIKELINKNVITILEKKLSQNGENFPYPELLQSET